MATLITKRCISCGACEPVCPGDGIRRGNECFVIDPERCTECVGFYSEQRCRAVCPIEGGCVRDPERIETEAVLFERASKLAAAGGDAPPVLTYKTSHFRADQAPPWWQRLFSGLQPDPPLIREMDPS